MSKCKVLLRNTLGSFLLAYSSGLYGVTYNVWEGGTSGSQALDISSNWSLGLPVSTQVAEFTSTSPAGFNLRTDNGFSVEGVQFDTGAPSYGLYIESSVAGNNINIGPLGVVNNSSNSQLFETDAEAGGSIIFAAIPGGVNSAGVNVNYTTYGNSNGGALVFQGPTSGTGSVTLGDANSLFVVGGDSSIGQLTTVNGSTILLNGSLTTTLSEDTLAAGNISGPGALIVDGPLNPGGAIYLDLSGTNTYTGGTILNGGGLIPTSALPGSLTINGGYLEVYTNGSSGSLSGSGGSFNWEDNSTNFNVKQTNNGTFAGTFIGSVAGSTFTLGTPSSTSAMGTLRLTGNSSGFTGNVVVDSGNLQVNGNLGAGSVLVNSGATLSGTGTIGSPGKTVTIASGGILSPGNSIGVMTNAGNHTFNTGSIFRVEENGYTTGPVTPSIDLLVVNGTAIVNAATVDLTTTDGAINFNTKQAFLTTGSGLTVNGGGFTVNTSALTAFNPAAYSVTAIYDANNYYLLAQTQFVSELSTSGGDPNALKIGTAIDSTVDPSTSLNLFINELAQLSSTELVVALDGLSGAQYASEAFIAEVSNRQFIRRLYDPLRSIVTREPCGACCASYDSCFDFYGFDVWAEAGGGQRDVRGDYGFKFNEWDVTLGLQKTFGQFWTFGAAGSYEHNKLNYHSFNSSSDGYSAFGGLYGLYRPQDYYILADIAYGYTEHKMHRNLIFGDVVNSFESKPEVSQVTFYAEAGFDTHFSCFLIQPFVGIEVAGFWRDSFLESDLDASGLALNIRKNERTNTTSSLGVHLTDQLSLGFNVSVDLAWLYRFTNNDRIKAYYGLFDSDFTFDGAKIGRSSGEGAITVSNDLSDKLRVYVEASGEIWNRASTYNILGGLQYTW